MICAYCKENKDRTKEHIISDSVLELFPECDLTYDIHRNKHYKADPVINDVCSECNNKRLSYIDNYAKGLISKYFLDDYEPNDKVEIEYEYDKILKVLMKYTYNDIRSHKKSKYTFNGEFINFLLEEENITSPNNITVMGGLWVNTSPMPEFFVGNKKLSWVMNPIFLDNSMIEYYDHHTGQVFIRKEKKIFNIKGLEVYLLFYFGIILKVRIHMILCWTYNIHIKY